MWSVIIIVWENSDFIHQRITYEQRCKDVTSKHCGGGPVVLKKREAEADPQFWGGYGLPGKVMSIISM